MIRNVVMGRLREDLDADGEATFAQGLAGIAALRLPGQLSMSVGRDAGLRSGGWTFAIVNDWADVESYHGYDADEEHGRYRAMIGSGCAEIARVQFEIG